MGISHLSERTPHRLSEGEKKKVALASVLVMEPKVILLDEPTAGLDPRSQAHLVELLQDWVNPKEPSSWPPTTSSCWGVGR